MRCPFCTASDTKVIDSRLASEGSVIRRRRACQQCGERFTTFESAELVYPRVVKSDGRREPFNEDKLRHGFQISLEKRPVDSEAIESAIDRIKRRLHGLGEREVAARLLGAWAMAELLKLDEVAYVRFASVYHRFQDLNAFQNEIKRLQQGVANEHDEIAQETDLPAVEPVDGTHA
ncbi:MAG: transcriptional repressor NrdR [Gammaproteobacteria bacterium]|nr:transcriptional repressor NrdR [Gammaproteobacteria bacterium]